MPRRPTGPALWGMLRAVTGLACQYPVSRIPYPVSRIPYPSIPYPRIPVSPYPRILSYSQLFSVFLSILRSPPVGSLLQGPAAGVNEEQITSKQLAAVICGGIDSVRQL